MRNMWSNSQLFTVGLLAYDGWYLEDSGAVRHSLKLKIICHVMAWRGSKSHIFDRHNSWMTPNSLKNFLKTFHQFLMTLLFFHSIFYFSSRLKKTNEIKRRSWMRKGFSGWWGKFLVKRKRKKRNCVLVRIIWNMKQ